MAGDTSGPQGRRESCSRSELCNIRISLTEHLRKHYPYVDYRPCLIQQFFRSASRTGLWKAEGLTYHAGPDLIRSFRLVSNPPKLTPPPRASRSSPEVFTPRETSLDGFAPAKSNRRERGGGAYLCVFACFCSSESGVFRAGRGRFEHGWVRSSLIL